MGRARPARRAIRGIVLAAVLPASCAARMVPSAAVTSAGVRFELTAADAGRVAVAGSFNQWSISSHPLVRRGSGRWTLVVALPAGEHQFMFVVDGTRWVSPPFAEDYVDDGFGSPNGVVVVPGDR
jgi:1,4-alpha-glucan branching enzyme